MAERRILEGRTALVTGGGRGIGRSHALALAAAGARVLVNDVGSNDQGDVSDGGPAQAVVREIVERGGQAVADTTSVSSWAGGCDVVRHAIDAFGDIDIVVNNAGVSLMATIDQVDEAGWQRTLDINLTGPASTMHHASAHWRESGEVRPRAIINTSSPAGTNPGPEGIAYCSTKAAVAAMTVSAAGAVHKFGARVNAIAPIALTRMFEKAPPFILEAMKAQNSADFDAGDPDNIAPLALYLASPACRFTGRTFGISGAELYLFDGYSARQHLSNNARRWTFESMAEALERVDPQDRGWAIAPGMHFPGPTPGDQVLAELGQLAG
jgi:NAD(P)-dependent dehydrogenase (short-subunit alcohol dehydrogenase family)